MEWQPIETAPKGRRILVGWWDYGFGNEPRWKQGSGEVKFSLISNKAVLREFGKGHATHWKPLPEPPND